MGNIRVMVGYKNESKQAHDHIQTSELLTEQNCERSHDDHPECVLTFSPTIPDIE
jgi:hypothetical protein